MPGRHPNRRYYASAMQIHYLRRLLDQAFARHITHGLCLDRHNLSTLRRQDASNAIDTLRRMVAY